MFRPKPLRQIVEGDRLRALHQAVKRTHREGAFKFAGKQLKNAVDRATGISFFNPHAAMIDMGASTIAAAGVAGSSLIGNYRKLRASQKYRKAGMP